MRYRRVIAAVVVVCAACSASPVDAQDRIIGTASVIDGDTLEIHGDRIRLNGYDTPERGKRCEGGINAYQQAAQQLDRFIGQRPVTCIDTGDRNNGRIIGICSAGGKDFGEHMVSSGWGRDWPRYSDGRYADEEAAARASRRGVWGLRDCPDLWSGRDYSR